MFPITDVHYRGTHCKREKERERCGERLKKNSREASTKKENMIMQGKRKERPERDRKKKSR